MRYSGTVISHALERYAELKDVRAVATETGLHYNTIRKWVLRVNAKCVCGKPLDGIHMLCESCRESRRRISNERYLAWKNAGLCIVCGGVKPPHRSRCEPCDELHRVRNRAHHAKYRPIQALRAYDGNRGKALERDGYRCRLCGKEGTAPKLHVHHRDHGKTNHALDNLITLCIVCHAAITRLAAIPEEQRHLAFQLAFHS